MMAPKFPNVVKKILTFKSRSSKNIKLAKSNENNTKEYHYQIATTKRELLESSKRKMAHHI